MILERLAGERLSDYLRPRLLEPLDITAFTWAQWPFHTSERPQAIDMGFSGVFTNLDAIAKLGQVHLDLGRSRSEAILPEEWITEASSTQTLNPDGDTIDWQQGYGFQLWQSQHGYRGDGAFGQFMVVLPEQHAVVAMFASTGQLQLILDAIWEHVLPALEQPGSASADAALAGRLSGLTLPTAAQRLSSGFGREALDGHFTPGPPSVPTTAPHPTISSIDVLAGRLIVNEHGENPRPLDLPLTERWSVSGNIATSAAHDHLGSLIVDVAFLNTPHRLALTMANGQLQSDWGRVPHFGAGISNRLFEIAEAPG